MGPDSCQPPLAAPPRFASAEQAAELVELYWMALARDVAFIDYDAHPVIAQACDDLVRLSDLVAPRQGGRITPATVFRGPTPGDLAGPYLSQFLWKDIPLQPIRVEQRVRTAIPGVDYLTRFDDWLTIENGGLAGVNRYDDVPRYMRSGRDVTQYVHRDFSYQAYLGACLAALRWGVLPDGGNPYKHSRTQNAFATFGSPFLVHLLGEVTQAALKAAWFQKWRVHRRLRPEELAGRTEVHLTGRASYPLHPELLASAGLASTRQRQGTALLSQAFPEGCPLHPSYPAGHAVIAGACATVLKAAFNESFVVPDPVVASADGTRLLPWKGEDLTVGGELDKLATNIAFARNLAGLHWRSDGLAGLAFGEAVALEVLNEQARDRQRALRRLLPARLRRAPHRDRLTREPTAPETPPRRSWRCNDPPRVHRPQFSSFQRHSAPKNSVCKCLLSLTAEPGSRRGVGSSRGRHRGQDPLDSRERAA